MLSAVSPLQVCYVGLVSRKIVFFKVAMITNDQQKADACSTTLSGFGIGINVGPVAFPAFSELISLVFAYF